MMDMKFKSNFTCTIIKDEETEHAKRRETIESLYSMTKSMSSAQAMEQTHMDEKTEITIHFGYSPYSADEIVQLYVNSGHLSNAILTLDRGKGQSGRTLDTLSISEAKDRVRKEFIDGLVNLDKLENIETIPKGSIMLVNNYASSIFRYRMVGVATDIYTFVPRHQR